MRADASAGCARQVAVTRDKVSASGPAIISALRCDGRSRRSRAGLGLEREQRLAAAIGARNRLRHVLVVHLLVGERDPLLRHDVGRVVQQLHVHHPHPAQPDEQVLLRGAAGAAHHQRAGRDHLILRTVGEQRG
jgi:hypothetical protein